MIVFIGFMYFGIIQWLSQKYRLSRYNKMIRPCLGRANSIMVQRVRALAPLINTQVSQVKVPLQYQKKLGDDYLDISIVEPKQTVNLESWSADSMLPQTDTNLGDDFLVLLQATTINELTHKLREIPVGYKIHVFQDFYPLAWKAGNPYEVIFRTTITKFIKMMDDFGQGKLTMGDDLELVSLTTVHAVGRPFTPSTESHRTFDFDTSSGSLSNLVSSKSQIMKPENELTENQDETKVNSSQTVEFYLGSKEERLKTTSKKDVKTPHDYPNTQDDEKTTEGKIQPQTIKPPNILVFTGINDADERYLEIKDLLEQCINRDAYTIYHLKQDQLLSTPWMDNVALLVLACKDAAKNTDSDDIFCNFFQKGGNILSFGSSFENCLIDVLPSSSQNVNIQFSYKNWKDIHGMSSKFHYRRDGQKLSNAVSQILGENDENNEGLIALITSDKSKSVLIQLYLDKDPVNLSLTSSEFKSLKQSNKSRMEILQDIIMMLDVNCSSGTLPDLTPAYLLTSSKDFMDSFLKCFNQVAKNKSIKGKSVTLQLVEDESTLKPTDSHLPLIATSTTREFHYFASDVYWKNLTSSCLGQVLIYTDVIPTTMSLFDGFMFSVPENIGAVAIAGRQTSGRGRGGNSWLSPVGCAMFSVHVQIDKDSGLGGKITFLQHIMSLAVVQSVRSLPGCGDLPLKLKWPNDIYYERSIKLGGVIVNCSVVGSTIHAIIGCGFNVSNSNPTICINDIISQYNKEHKTTISMCRPEQLIARTISNTEKLIQLFQSQGHQAFCELYYKNWIHSSERVQVESLDFSLVTVSGLDEFGFLEVKKDDGSVFSLQPDGNSFDIMHNLIAIKKF
ncbi:biotin--protein ligase [Patella vulgata]|uniref:biotin--protein ligase n=1 Tax=Patella vulgata TaxID=6465 RepID=UPI0021806A56|nr:biotin--protein ligase [Patella vulgata]